MPDVAAIHIGFARCASTWLQTRLFPRLTSLSLVIGPKFCQDIINLGEAVYAPGDTAERARQAFAALSSPVLLTNEGLADGQGRGCYGRVAARLRELFPRAKVLVVLRNQVDILKSLYKYDIRLGYGFPNFAAYVAYCRSRYYLQDFLYHHVCGLYAELFPAVKFVLFEELFRTGTVRDIAGFLGQPLDAVDGLSFAPVNAVSDGLSLGLTRLLNRIAGTKLQGHADVRLYTAWRYGFGRKVRRSIPGWLAARFPERYDAATLDFLRREYAASNAALQDFFDRDIRPFGYVY